MRGLEGNRASAALLIAGVMAFSAAGISAAGADADVTTRSADGTGGAGSNEQMTLLLNVVVNGRPIGKIGEFVLRNGQLFARGEELHDLGFRAPDATGPTASNLIGLGLPGLKYRLDLPGQTLYVTADTSVLLPQLLGSAPAAAFTIESGLGVTLNYDLVADYAHNLASGSGQFDGRIFSPWGVASSGLLVFSGGGPSGPDTASVVRLDSTYVYSDPETMRRYRAGDFISGFLPWTRAVRMGGIQINSDFSMRPDLITFPVPQISGTASVPSTVDVLVNNTRVLSQQVQAGPFAVPQPPVITGAGSVAVTVTDALGKQVTTELPFYASSDLLAPDLQTYSFEAGFVRRDWGILSNDYGPLAAAATWRRGLSNDVTVEGHVEGSDGLYMGGAGVVANLFDFAAGHLAIAGSTGDRHDGAQLSVGIERNARPFSLVASAIFATRNFGDIAAINGDPVAQLELNASAGLTLGQYGALAVAYTAIDRDEKPFAVTSLAAPQPGFSPQGLAGSALPQPVQHASILSASYSAQFGGVSLFATGYHDFARGGGDGAFIGLTVPLGPRSSVTPSVQSSSGLVSAEVQATQSADLIGEWGYNVLAAADHPSHGFAQVSYKAPFALVSAGVDQLGNETTVQAEAQGAFTLTDGEIFATNTIFDSFAVVDTNGVPDVEVERENLYAGKTDSSGKVLVPDLRAFEPNHLSIAPLGIPLDVSVPFTARDVRPQDRSGVVVKFPLKKSYGVLLKLVDDSGHPLAVGSAATVVATGTVFPVGYDGETYLTGLTEQNVIKVEVERPDGKKCAVAFDYRREPGRIPSIGPLRCGEVKK